MGFLDFFTGSKENEDFYKSGNYSKMFEGNNNAEYYRQKAKENGPYVKPGTSNIKKGNNTKKNLKRNQRVALMGGPQPVQPQTNKSNSLAAIPNFKGGKRTRKLHKKTRKH